HLSTKWNIAFDRSGVDLAIARFVGGEPAYRLAARGLEGYIDPVDQIEGRVRKKYPGKIQCSTTACWWLNIGRGTARDAVEGPSVGQGFLQGQLGERVVPRFHKRDDDIQRRTSDIGAIALRCTGDGEG